MGRARGTGRGLQRPALFARPRHTLEDVRAPLIQGQRLVPRHLAPSRWLYGDALLASLLINLLGLMVPLFVMQT
jgi:ATP-binding cassette subfamily C protein LapB